MLFTENAGARKQRRAKRLWEILIAARAARGLKQTELAKLLARPQSFVSNYERGQRRLGVVEFIDLAEALGLNPAEVVGELAGMGRARWMTLVL